MHYAEGVSSFDNWNFEVRLELGVWSLELILQNADVKYSNLSSV